MADKKPTILLIEDDDGIRSQMRWAFCDNYEVLEAEGSSSAIKQVKSVMPELVILDLCLPPTPENASEGMKVFSSIRNISKNIKILVVTGRTEKELALKAIDQGAFDFFSKPVDLDEIRITAKRALHIARLEKENESLISHAGVSALDEMLGTSRAMETVFQTIRKVSSVDIPVLIRGESGTGKDLAARAIHEMSRRKKGAFVAINCGAIPENLLESELFGYEKGAFTGAEEQRKGKFEYAHGGTLFLDEIGELPPGLQVKLLRFLQDQKINRLGGRREIALNVRIITATNREIHPESGSDLFREDLYYRLAVATIKMPPLREREGDIILLAQQFLKTYSEAFNKNVSKFSNSALVDLEHHRWPGNVRELANKIQRAVAMSSGNEISAEDLAIAPGRLPEVAENFTDLLSAREDFEKKMIRASLARNRGVITRSAKDLGISRQYLTQLISKWDIKPKRQ